MSPEPAADLARLRAIAMALPGTCEKVSHGETVFFSEKGRVFTQFWHNHHGDGRSAVMVKTGGPDEQDMLIAHDPVLFYKPPYLGPSGWIAIRTDQVQTDWEHIAARVETSWRMLAPRKWLEAQ